MRRWLRRAVRLILLALLALVIAYEELQWRLSAVFALLGKLPLGNLPPGNLPTRSP